MAITLILHINDEDSVVGEVDVMPQPIATMVTLMNPRRLDGKDLHYLSAGVSIVTWPLYRINFI